MNDSKNKENVTSPSYDEYLQYKKQLKYASKIPRKKPSTDDYGVPRVIGLQTNEQLQRTTHENLQTNVNSPFRTLRAGVTTLAGNQALDESRDQKPLINESKIVCSGIKEYIKVKLYHLVKFVDPSTTETIVYRAWKDGHFTIPYGHTVRSLVKKYAPKVFTQIAALRHNGQSVSRRKYLGRYILQTVVSFVFMAIPYTIHYNVFVVLLLHRGS